jgi:hypothetical protein
MGHGDHAYIMGNEQWTVLSLGEGARPVVVAQWTFDPADPSRWRETIPHLPRRLSELSTSSLPCGFHPCSQVAGNLLVTTNGVALAILDLSDPNDPMVVCSENLWSTYRIAGDTIRAVAMDQDCVYLSTQQGLIVRRIIRRADGPWSTERIGYRAATPLERWSGRSPRGLLLSKGSLVESDGAFGVIVYDVSDPAHPRRVMHSDSYSEGIGIWNGLLYTYGTVSNQLTLLDLPARP